MTTVGVYAFNLFNLADPNNDINLMLDDAVIGDASIVPAVQDTRANWVGQRLGKIFTKIFNVQVPDVQYQVYN